MTDKDSEPIPFFSVVTCTFNRAGILRRALDSLVAQTCRDWECIIVDDESGDDTDSVVQPYLGARFRYLRHTHRGCALSKNAGMWAARGTYVTFLDSDDEYMPQHLAIRKEILLREPTIDLLHSDVDVIGNPFVPDRNDPGKLIAVRDCVVGGSFVLRRTLAVATGGFKDVPLGDDMLLMEQLRSGNHQIKKISAPTYIYHRDTPDSMCTDLIQTPS